MSLKVITPINEITDGLHASVVIEEVGYCLLPVVQHDRVSPGGQRLGVRGVALTGDEEP